LFIKYTRDRKLMFFENALYIIIETIYSVWKSKKNLVALLLMLDIKRAFDNVFYLRLIHNL